MQSKEHWEDIYSTKPANSVSWFQEHAELSLQLIRGTGVPLSASIIDVGGGSSTLVDDLLNSGYSALTVLDLSAAALAVAQKRLGSRSSAVQWIEANIAHAVLPTNTYHVWHDRAVKPGGHVIVATFAEDGPTQCSGLSVRRYSPNELHAEFGAPFTLLQHTKEEHHTPFGTIQKFVYCYCRKSH